MIRRALDEVFSAAEWRYDVYETSRDEDYRSVVVKAIEDGCGIVVAVGGDGTVALTASHLVGTDVPLAIIPAGTGNILSRELGIHLDPEAALETIVGEHRTIAIDAMRVGDRHYFLNAGIGLPATVMRDTSREAKQRFGMLAYARTAIQKLRRPTTERFRVIVDGKARRIRAAFVMVVNAAATGVPELRWASESSADDGTVEVVAAKARNLRDYLTILWRVWTGNPVAGPVRQYRAKRRVTIAARRDIAVQADGEVIGTRNLDVHVVPPPFGSSYPRSRARSRSRRRRPRCSGRAACSASSAGTSGRSA